MHMGKIKNKLVFHDQITLKRKRKNRKIILMSQYMNVLVRDITHKRGNKTG